jgi:hypothetical protein
MHTTSKDNRDIFSVLEVVKLNGDISLRPGHGALGTAHYAVTKKQNGQLVPQTAIQFQINLEELATVFAPRILHSAWAQEISRRQALPKEFKIRKEAVDSALIDHNHKVSDALALGRGLVALPESERSFLEAGQPIRYGKISFERSSEAPFSWRFTTEDDHRLLKLDPHLLIDLAARVLRDPYVKKQWPHLSVECLGAFTPSDVWTDEGRLIDPYSEHLKLDSERDVLSVPILRSAYGADAELELRRKSVSRASFEFVRSVEAFTPEQREQEIANDPSMRQIFAAAKAIKNNVHCAKGAEAPEVHELHRAVVIHEFQGTVAAAQETIAASLAEARQEFQAKQLELQTRSNSLRIERKVEFDEYCDQRTREFEKRESDLQQRELAVAQTEAKPQEAQPAPDATSAVISAKELELEERERALALAEARIKAEELRISVLRDEMMASKGHAEEKLYELAEQAEKMGNSAQAEQALESIDQIASKFDELFGTEGEVAP